MYDKTVKNVITGLCLFCFVNIAYANDWQHHNRNISITAGILQQNYQEIDHQNITQNGILNSEKADIHQINLTARYQHPSHLWLQGQISNVTGATNYDGYLQDNGQLVPFESISDNHIKQLSASVGYGIAIHPKLHIIPNISTHHQKWKRRLSQYDEYFNNQAIMAGLITQYQPHDKITLELSANIGKQNHSQLNVPKFDFQQPLNKQNIWQTGGKISYQPQTNLAILGEVNHQFYHYGKSATQNDLTYPSGKSKQTNWLMGMKVFY